VKRVVRSRHDPLRRSHAHRSGRERRGLIAAALLLDCVDIDVTTLLVAVVIFTAVFALIQPFLAVQLRRAGSAALGGVALIATLVSLIE